MLPSFPFSPSEKSLKMTIILLQPKPMAFSNLSGWARVHVPGATPEVSNQAMGACVVINTVTRTVTLTDNFSSHTDAIQQMVNGYYDRTALKITIEFTTPKYTNLEKRQHVELRFLNSDDFDRMEDGIRGYVSLSCDTTEFQLKGLHSISACSHASCNWDRMMPHNHYKNEINIK